MRALLFAVLAACAPTAMTVDAEHPASPNAPTGRLAGPPPALRPGVVDAPAEPPPSGHEHHEHGTPSPSAPPPTTPKPEPPKAEPPKAEPPKAPPPKEQPPKPKQPPKPEPPKQPPPTHDHGHHH